MRIQEENYRDEKKVPKVSVVMPIYNEKRVELVRKAVDSVLTQSLKEIELLLINDGSDRLFWEKTVRQLPKEEKIRIISLPHKGLAAALNSGIEVARGSYIARMDGDDLSRPCRLEKEVSFLEQNPDFDWVGCNACVDGSKWDLGTSENAWSSLRRRIFTIILLLSTLPFYFGEKFLKRKNTTRCLCMNVQRIMSFL